MPRNVTLSLRRVGTYCGRLSSPSPSGHSMARGRRSISDVSQRRWTGLMSATLASNRYAGNMHGDVHRANIAGAPCSSEGSRHAVSNKARAAKHSVTRYFRSMKGFLDGATPAYKFRLSVSRPRPDNKESDPANRPRSRRSVSQQCRVTSTMRVPR